MRVFVLMMEQDEDQEMESDSVGAWETVQTNATRVSRPVNPASSWRHLGHYDDLSVSMQLGENVVLNKRLNA